MCHGQPLAAFPAPPPARSFRAAVAGLTWQAPDQTAGRIAILPDIYGCNLFYQGFSARYLARGYAVYLVDPFDGLGDLPEVTREAAFARRHKVRDRAFVDAMERFVAAEQITGVIGFCLGGLYVFDLARRGVEAALVGFYGFPQGMANADPLIPPVDYLDSVKTPNLALMGADDAVVGAAHIARLADIGRTNPALDVVVYDGVGHNFLPLLDSDDPALRGIAQDAMARCDAALETR